MIRDLVLLLLIIAGSGLVGFVVGKAVFDKPCNSCNPCECSRCGK